MKNKIANNHYHKIYDKVVSAREASLSMGMLTILDIPEESYSTLLQVCQDANYVSYIPYVAERLEQLISWGVIQIK